MKLLVLYHQQLHLKYLCILLPTAELEILVYCITNSCTWILVYSVTNSCTWNTCVFYYQQLHLKYLCILLPTAALEILVYSITNSCTWNTCVFSYQRLHLKYLCNLARYWLQAPRGWNDSVETCRSVVICELIVHLLVIVRNNKRCTVRVLKTIYCMSV
jgi:hypothetical protein